jgi:hypothetical protein
MQARQYVNQQTATRRAEENNQPKQKKAGRPTMEREHVAPSYQPQAAGPTMRPIDLAWNEVGVYPLLTVLLGVVGIYFAVWLANGGAQELSLWFMWR